MKRLVVSSWLNSIHCMQAIKPSLTLNVCQTFSETCFQFCIAKHAMNLQLLLYLPIPSQRVLCLHSTTD